jgi:hypothetical protein
MTRVCQVCGQAFEAKRADARFCSVKCRVKAHRQTNGLSRIETTNRKRNTGLSLKGDVGKVYFVRRVGKVGPIKIGRSIHVERRLKQLQRLVGAPLEILAVVTGAAFTERYMHDRFSGCRLYGEWFHPTRELLWIVTELQAAQTALSRGVEEESG